MKGGFLACSAGPRPFTPTHQHKCWLELDSGHVRAGSHIVLTLKHIVHTQDTCGQNSMADTTRCQPGYQRCNTYAKAALAALLRATHRQPILSVIGHGNRLIVSAEAEQGNQWPKRLFSEAAPAKQACKVCVGRLPQLNNRMPRVMYVHALSRDWFRHELWCWVRGAGACQSGKI